MRFCSKYCKSSLNGKFYLETFSLGKIRFSGHGIRGCTEYIRVHGILKNIENAHCFETSVSKLSEQTYGKILKWRKSKLDRILVAYRAMLTIYDRLARYAHRSLFLPKLSKCTSRHVCTVRRFRIIRYKMY